MQRESAAEAGQGPALAATPSRRPPLQPPFKQAPCTHGSPDPGAAHTHSRPAPGKAPADGAEHSHAADVAAVVLDEALELLQGVVVPTALKLLPVGLREQQGLE